MGQRFVGNVTVSVTYVGIPLSLNEVQVIPTSCSPPVYEGSVYGNIVVLNGTSVNGGPLCCSAAGMEHTPPAAPVCPANINLNLAANECSKIVPWTPPAVPTDNCGNVTLSSTRAPGTSFGVGTTPVTYTATDDYGNTSSCSFNVTINDITAPVFTNCNPAAINAIANGS